MTVCGMSPSSKRLFTSLGVINDDDDDDDDDDELYYSLNCLIARHTCFANRVDSTTYDYN